MIFSQYKKRPKNESHKKRMALSFLINTPIAGRFPIKSRSFTFFSQNERTISKKRTALIFSFKKRTAYIQTAIPSARKNRDLYYRNPIIPQKTDTQEDNRVILLPAVQSRNNPMFARGGMGVNFPWNALNNKHLNSNDYKKLNPKRMAVKPYDKKEIRFPKSR